MASSLHIGGAWNIPTELEQDHLAGVRKAVELIFPKLQAGMSALDAVEEAVKILELDPTFDSGRGAFLNAAGEVELDASIMDGRNLDFGAVGAVRDILHPVTLARAVMEKTEHSFIVGKGANQLAEAFGIPTVDPKSLLTERELAFYDKVKSDPNFRTRQPFENPEEEPHDTVGAVAMDIYGNLAAATSTGGTPRKLPGRLGDSPIVGSGVYADNFTGAASATGYGECIMKVVFCKTACDYLMHSSSMDSASLVVRYMKSRVNGLGGIIMVDRDGKYGFAYNTPKMAFAYADPNTAEVISHIKGPLPSPSQ
eukprot:TRINITY_DN3362_c0_g1_i2.p2 TRINITY_DN3362_c0_g1~~TRINITY_DN3362_c0_g1_i2.p2  ORF type:complete len:311 (+),score=86.63 TRINITY_DN3362_c0_g1_i2:252-1184(+)